MEYSKGAELIMSTRINEKVKCCNQALPDRIIFILMSIIVAQYTYVIIKYPFFSFSDEAEFMPYLKGEGSYPWRYFPEYGRCYVLSLLEYFPVAAADIFSIKEKMFLMYCINAIKIGLIIYLTKRCFDKITSELMAFAGLCVTMVLMIKFGLFTTILTLTYPEFSLILLFVLFTLFYIKGVEKNSNKYYLLAVLVALLSLLFKETASVLYLIFICARLITSWRTLEKVEKITIFSLLICLTSYFIFFYLAIYNNKTKDFYPAVEANYILNFLTVAKTNIVLIPSLVVMLLRMYYVFVQKKPAALSDVLITVSFFYATPFIYMGLAASYYFSPCLFFFMAGILGYIPKEKVFFINNKLQSLLCAFLCLVLIVSNYYYVEYKSEQYTLKKITLPLLKFVNTLEREGISQQFIVKRNPSEKSEEFSTMVALWFYDTLCSYKSFYFSNRNAIVLLQNDNLYGASGKAQILYFYDQGGQWQPVIDGKFVILDFVFVQAIVRIEDLSTIEQFYTEFYSSINDSKIRPFNRNKVDIAFEEMRHSLQQ